MYLAAPLFTEGERAFNVALARRIERLGYRVFLPQRDVPAAGGRRRTRSLYRGCVRGLRAADLVVAVCDGATADDGTAWEVGHAVALGKPVYGLRTDSRRVRADEHVNLMIQESVCRLCPTVPGLLAALRRAGPRDGRGASRHLTRR